MTFESQISYVLSTGKRAICHTNLLYDPLTSQERRELALEIVKRWVAWAERDCSDP